MYEFNFTLYIKCNHFTTAVLTHKLPLSWISLHVSFISFSCIISIYVNILCTNHVDVSVITAFNLTVYTHF